MHRIKNHRCLITANLVMLTGVVWAAALWQPARPAQAIPPVNTPAKTVTGTPAPTTGNTGLLPGRKTPTAATNSPVLAGTPDHTFTPLATSPFTFPTSPPTQSPTPTADCTKIFPLDSVEAVEPGYTTLPQLEASFGQASYESSGRATRFRFEHDGCVMLATMGFQEVQTLELRQYGTLDVLLERYGLPDAAGISGGNLTLLMVGYAVLFYPDAGMIAVFDVDPGDLTRDTPVASLTFQPPYEVENQLTRLNAEPVDWQPPPR
ncbi:MAG: hypothetical protein JW966_07160 [Anaerolineae bacterium]|nr:hypothetical protein [Anaerolineae bacterium]